jgi:hypothetical protein
MGPNTPDNSGVASLGGSVRSEPVIPPVSGPVGNAGEMVAPAPSVIDAAKEAANIGSIHESSASSLDQFTRFGNGTTPLATDVSTPTAPVPGDVSIGANVAGIETVTDLLSTEARQSSDASPTPSSTIEKVKMPKTAEEQLIKDLSTAKDTIENIEAYLKEKVAEKITA